jgi:glycosyltransferase involved in cell wall biosynthesis
MILSANHRKFGPGEGTHIDARPLRVCYFGTYRAEYSRNLIMIEGLRQNGIEVVECHARLWQGIEDRVQVASGGWLRFEFLRRTAGACWRLLRAYRQVGDYDVMVLGYPGQLDAYVGRLLTWIRRKPLVLDVFMSIYLIAQERGLTQRHRLTGRFLYRLEKLALRLPDLLVQDTAEYVEWLHEVYGLDKNRFRLVPTGADERIFTAQEPERRDDSAFLVLYYGTFTPNHGVEYIVEAAALLKDRPEIQFKLIGDGPTKASVTARVQEHGLTNVILVGWMDQLELLSEANKADLHLGAFGTTPQSTMTVQNKIYEGLAMRRCVVTGDSPTVRNALVHGKQAWLCERANPESLARSILMLSERPALRERIAERGHARFLTEYSTAVLGARFGDQLRKLASRS